MNSGRIKFLLIVFIFTVPFVISYYLSKDYHAGGELQTSNYGSFINPIVELSESTFDDYSGENLNVNQHLTKWSLIYRMPKNCSQICSDEIYLVRQVNIALGKDMNRLERVIVLNQTIPSSEVDDLVIKYPKAIVVKNNSSTFINEINKITDRYVLLLTDPLGNVILGYDEGFEGKKLLKDIKKLLKLSKIG
tara:strand:+ start:2267 stop:2842 length:576 start_codon:yes stop_codon:yes gene_type:complete